jgi:hypothetical protein
MPHPVLDMILRELLASNRGPDYGVSVIGAAGDLSTIDVELRFLAERTYCCPEPGCHLPQNNEQLVRLSAASSIQLPDSVVVRWQCRVEPGARFNCMRELGLPTQGEGYAFEFEVPRLGG